MMRAAVFLSALLLCLCYVLFACVTGIPLMGGFQADTGTILLLLLGNLLTVVAYCSLFTLIEMLSASRTGAIVTALLVTLVLLALGTLLVGRLQEPEWLSMASGVDETGSLIFGQAQPNPSYLGGPMRTVFQVLVNLLPTGQAFSLAGEQLADLPKERWEALITRLLLEAAETGAFRQGADACHIFIEPLGHGAESIVVEGIHGHRTKAVVGTHGIPALPHGGRAHGDFEKPTWAFLLQQ